MKYLSICSGIEAASVAWHPLGWKPLAFSEIEPFPRKVLAHHYPDVPLHGDFTLLRHEQWIKDADVLVGGTPCQAFSIAGLRKSLDDDRGNLTLEFVRLANAIDNLRSDPAIIVWENVPGVLSVKDNAFGCFLAALVGNDTPLVPTGGRWTNAGLVIGPQRSAAWRVLDAQYFGVAQRRRRVFVVASAREGFDPAEVLFEREGVRRDSPPSREAGEEVAPTIRAGASNSGAGHGARSGDSKDELITVARMAAFGEYVDDGTASAIKACDWKDATDLVAFHPTQDPISSTDGTTHALGCGSSQGQASIAVAVGAFKPGQSSAARSIGYEENVSPSLEGGGGGNNKPAIHVGMAVRRLTPRECERLQGFPDDYTAIPGAADGPRYKALGNSMAVPVMRWIGDRIQKKVLVPSSDS